MVCTAYQLKGFYLREILVLNGEVTIIKPLDRPTRSQIFRESFYFKKKRVHISSCDLAVSKKVNCFLAFVTFFKAFQVA